MSDVSPWPPDWSKLPPWARFAVVQKGGLTGLALDNPPILSVDHGWFRNQGRTHYFAVPWFDGAWQDSLVERPAVIIV